MAKGTVNRMILLGRLGKDPEVHPTAGGGLVTKLLVATVELGAKDERGRRSEETEWHRVALFGKNAETAAQYLLKGASVYVEGKLKTRKWQDQSGIDRFTTEIEGESVQMMGGGPSANPPEPQQ